MINFIREIWSRYKADIEERRRAEAETAQILRDNIRTWNENNKEYVDECNRRTDRDCDKFSDISDVPDPNAYTFDDRPLSR